LPPRQRDLRLGLGRVARALRNMTPREVLNRAVIETVAWLALDRLPFGPHVAMEHRARPELGARRNERGIFRVDRSVHLGRRREHHLAGSPTGFLGAGDQRLGLFAPVFVIPGRASFSTLGISTVVAVPEMSTDV